MRDGPAGRAEAQQIKTFDQDGNPVDTVTIVGRSWKIAPFQQVNQYEGQDMRKLFKEYLVTHGLKHLVPASD